MIFKAIGKAIGGAVKSVGKSLWNGVKNLGQGIFKVAKGALQVVPGMAFSFGKSLIQGKSLGEAFSAAGRSAVNGFKNIGQGAWQTAKGAIAVAPYVVPFMAGPAMAAIAAKLGPGATAALSKVNTFVGSIGSKASSLLQGVTKSPVLGKAVNFLTGGDPNKLLHLVGGKSPLGSGGFNISNLARQSILGNGKLDLGTVASVIGDNFLGNRDGKIDAKDLAVLFARSRN